VTSPPCCDTRLGKENRYIQLLPSRPASLAHTCHFTGERSAWWAGLRADSDLGAVPPTAAASGVRPERNVMLAGGEFLDLHHRSPGPRQPTRYVSKRSLSQAYDVTSLAASAHVRGTVGGAMDRSRRGAIGVGNSQKRFRTEDLRPVWRISRIGPYLEAA